MTLKQARAMAGKATWATHSREHVDAALALVAKELERVEQRHADIRALLNPACAEESIEGAIRNLQQALLSEQGNVATLEQRHAEAVGAWADVKTEYAHGHGLNGCAAPRLDAALEADHD